MNRKKLILDENRIHQIICRIAYQIQENNLGIKDFIIVGVCGQGLELAGKFVKELESIKASFRINLLEIKLGVCRT